MVQRYTYDYYSGKRRSTLFPLLFISLFGLILLAGVSYVQQQEGLGNNLAVAQFVSPVPRQDIVRSDGQPQAGIGGGPNDATPRTKADPTVSPTPKGQMGVGGSGDDTADQVVPTGAPDTGRGGK